MATTSYFSTLLLSGVSGVTWTSRKRVISPGSNWGPNGAIRLRTGFGSSTRRWAKVEDRGELLKGNCGFSVADVIDDGDSSNYKVADTIPERDYAGTPYIPVYVMLPLNTIDVNCKLVDPQNLMEQLKVLKSINVDGVTVDCWWGIVEALRPQEYNWTGYRELFQVVRDFGLKLQVVMSFHACGGNVGDDVHIPLPHWITEIGQYNTDIYFTDKIGRCNTETLSWGIDRKRVLRGRTAVEVYYDYMRSFRTEFLEFLEDGTISEIKVGLGPCGELRYPSNPARYGWKYPGIGEFQCYDRYLMKSLQEAAEVVGQKSWGRPPDNSGSYNSRPHETGFFRDRGEYFSFYGSFFLDWYSKVLIDHGDLVLTLAELAFGRFRIAAKLSGIYWWFKTASHAAEQTAGYYGFSHRDAYAPIAAMLKKHEAVLNFTCVELHTMDLHESYPEALVDPETLVHQVLDAARNVRIPIASENSLTCYHREGYNKILKNAKPRDDDPRRVHQSAFTYLRLNPELMEEYNFVEFERFVKRMHGESVPDLNLPRETSFKVKKILRSQNLKSNLKP